MSESGTAPLDGALTATAPRRAAARLLGPLLPYLLHLRPAEWPVMAAHTTLGWWLAAGSFRLDRDAWLGIGVWVVCLNGGTLALNSAFDRDEGDIAYLRRPPRVPGRLALVSMLLMLAGLWLTWSLPAGYRGAYLACLALSIAYSVPPLRLKAVAGADWLINMVGFGTLSPYAGWAITGRPLDRPHAVVLWAFCALFAALYPLTQLYQMDEDRARGDRTLALRLGLNGALAVAILSVAVAFGMFVGAGVAGGWGGGEDLLRWGALALAAAAWAIVLVPWYLDGRRWSSAEHQRGMYHALGAWALTDLAVIIGWVL